MTNDFWVLRMTGAIREYLENNIDWKIQQHNGYHHLGIQTPPQPPLEIKEGICDWYTLHHRCLKAKGKETDTKDFMPLWLQWYVNLEKAKLQGQKDQWLPGARARVRISGGQNGTGVLSELMETVCIVSLTMVGMHCIYLLLFAKVSTSNSGIFGFQYASNMLVKLRKKAKQAVNLKTLN